MAKFYMAEVVGTIVVTLLTMVQTLAQPCPCSSECEPCRAGYIEFAFQYRGATPSMITLKDDASTLRMKEMHQGDTIHVIGSRPSERFAGNKLTIYKGDEKHAVVNTTCAEIGINEVIGEFLVIMGRRTDGALVCCEQTQVDFFIPMYLTSPASIQTVSVEGQCGAVVKWKDPLILDCNLDGLSSTIASGTFFTPGTTKVTYTATDYVGNSSTREFTVTVEDTEAPLIANCPKDLLVTTSNYNGAAVTWATPEVTDNCSAEMVTSHTSGDVFPLGETVVTIEAVDGSGNVASCAFRVTVKYEEPTKEPQSPEIEPRENLIVSRLVTPDGDGSNDFWELSNINQFPDNRVLVVDRWGGVVFSATGYDNEKVKWTGESQGKGKLPAGTYFYVVAYKTGGRPKEQKGFIELIH